MKRITRVKISAEQGATLHDNLTYAQRRRGEGIFPDRPRWRSSCPLNTSTESVRHATICLARYDSILIGRSRGQRNAGCSPIPGRSPLPGPPRPPYRPYLNYEAHNCIIISRTDLHGFLSRNTAHPSSPPPHAGSALLPLRAPRRGRERSARRASYLDPREPTKRSSVARVHRRT